jgi:hypothetical protein
LRDISKVFIKILFYENSEEAGLYINIKLEKYYNEDFTLLKYIKTPENLNYSGYMLAKLIAQRGRPLTDGEFIKKSFLECALNFLKTLRTVRDF